MSSLAFDFILRKFLRGCGGTFFKKSPHENIRLTHIRIQNVAALAAELDMLKMQLKHKEEIIAIHNYYNKLKSGD